MLMDGWNAMNRYFKNNFTDGFRQDSMDLFLGNYVVEENEGIAKPSPLQLERDWKFYAVSYSCERLMDLPRRLIESMQTVLFLGSSFIYDKPGIEK